MKKIQNFDVQNSPNNIGQDKDFAGNSGFGYPSICYGATAAQRCHLRKDSDNPRGPSREGDTKYISVSQANGMIEAVRYA